MIISADMFAPALKPHAPLHQTRSANSLDFHITVSGGGVTGQSGAIQLGIARALVELEPTLRVALLRKEGFLTRDSAYGGTQKTWPAESSPSFPTFQALNSPAVQSSRDNRSLHFLFEADTAISGTPVLRTEYMVIFTTLLRQFPSKAHWLFYRRAASHLSSQDRCSAQRWETSRGKRKHLKSAHVRPIAAALVLTTKNGADSKKHCSKNAKMHSDGRSSLLAR